ERDLVRVASLGVLGLHHDSVGEEVAGALDLREFAAPQGGEQRQADQGAEAAEVAGRLPHVADFLIGEGTAAVGASLEAFGAGAYRPAMTGERVGGEKPGADAPFQEYAGELAQIIGCAGAAVVLDCIDGADEIAAGEVGDLTVHELGEFATQARQGLLD